MPARGPIILTEDEVEFVLVSNCLSHRRSELATQRGLV